MSAADWLKVAGGAVLVLAVFYDLFQSVVLPRPSVSTVAFARYLLRWLWRLWRWIGTRTDHLPRRENRLSLFGPIAVLVMFGGWAITLMLGYALMFDGQRAGMHPAATSFGDSLYFSAATLVPLSYGDVLPLTALARVTSIVESGTGIILSALVITLLFSLYQSFQRREEIVVTLDALAGAPPSGVQMLEKAAEYDMAAELDRTFDEWRHWSAAVLESHLAYPILVYFRSSHDNEAWLNSFGAVMDAATLVITTVDDRVEGAARLMITVGNHLVDDLASYFRLSASPDPYVERGEFDEAVALLRAAGYRCRTDADAWADFSAMRARYARPLNEMARLLAIIPAQWIGDRSYLPHSRRPSPAAEGLGR